MTARMRTIDQAIEEIKKEDPDTALTKNALRSWVKTGVIEAKKIGRKSYINLDRLYEYLGGGASEQPQEQPEDETVKLNPDGSREVCLKIVV